MTVIPLVLTHPEVMTPYATLRHLCLVNNAGGSNRLGVALANPDGSAAGDVMDTLRRHRLTNIWPATGVGSPPALRDYLNVGGRAVVEAALNGTRGVNVSVADGWEDRVTHIYHDLRGVPCDLSTIVREITGKSTMVYTTPEYEVVRKWSSIYESFDSTPDDLAMYELNAKFAFTSSRETRNRLLATRSQMTISPDILGTWKATSCGLSARGKTPNKAAAMLLLVVGNPVIAASIA